MGFAEELAEEPAADPAAFYSLRSIGKSVKVLDKVGARTSALDALKALKKLGAAQITHLKNRSSDGGS
jgi:hypothetical protein